MLLSEIKTTSVENEEMIENLEDRILTSVPANAVFTDTVYVKPESEEISYITDLQNNLDNKINIDDNRLSDAREPLEFDASKMVSGIISSDRLPSYVDDVIMAADLATIESLTLEAGKVYVAEDTNITYRWSGNDTTMAKIGSDLAIGETSSTAYRGDLGKSAYDHSQLAHAPATADKTSDNEISHTDVLVDGEFATAGIMVTDGAGIYSIDSNSYVQVDGTKVLTDNNFTNDNRDNLHETYEFMNNYYPDINDNIFHRTDSSHAAKVVYTNLSDAYNAISNDYIFCDTTSASFDITFPPSASLGDKIVVADEKGNFATNNIVIKPNGLNVNSETIP